MNKVLYISYDGMLEPLGQSQVLQYLKKLAVDNNIFLVSYEKQQDWNNLVNRNRIQKDIQQHKIIWLPLRYHKSPSGLATAYDLLIGTIVCLWLVVRHKIQIIHARSYVSSVIALVIKKILGKKFIFDMRGFWVDERVDGRIWPKNSRMYQIGKWFEKKFLINADVIVSLTYAAVDVMKRFPYLNALEKRYEVIPTCTNTELFKPCAVTKDRTVDNDEFILGYVGSIGTWYLFDEVVECFKCLLKIKSRSRFFIVNRGDHDLIKQKLSDRGISAEKYSLVSADHSQVGEYISALDAGIFFIKPVYSKIASCPTKMGEFLACGIPCLANSNVGDVEKILREENVGIVTNDLSPDNLAKAVRELLNLVNSETVKNRCVSVAKRRFSLGIGVQRYLEIYNSIA